MNKKVLLIKNPSLLPQATIDRFILANMETSDLALVLANHHTEILCVERDVQNRIRSQYNRESSLKVTSSDFFDCTVLYVSLRAGTASILKQFKVPPNPAKAETQIERRGKGPGRGYKKVVTPEEREAPEPIEVSVTLMHDSRRNQHRRRMREEQEEVA